MATTQTDAVIGHLRRAVLRQDAAVRGDGQLLAAFVERRDEAAFEALVRRHGPMAWGVCRRGAGNHHDAEDAFQATFLVLARKAASVRPREGVAGWLHGVARRVALKARAAASKRRGREGQAAETVEPAAVPQDAGRELQPLLDRELNGLPENYRLPILLCGLEGKTIREAARQLGWPQGTLAGRLARGRKLLARRLVNRGVVPSAGALAAVLSRGVPSAGAPAALTRSTVRAATTLAAGQAAVAGVVPARVAVLTEGVVRSMLLTRLSKAAAGLAVLGAVAFGGGLLTHGTAAGRQAGREQAGDRPAVGQPAPPGRDAGTVAGRDPARTDLDRLQGVWSVVAVERGGKPAEPEKAVFMVDGKRACWQTGASEMQGGLYLDPTTRPRSYDLVTSTRTIEGVYALDGDTLRLCQDLGTGAKRPAGFTTEKGSQRVLMVFKRLHGAEGFPYRAETEERRKLQGTWRLVNGFYGNHPRLPGVATGRNLLKTTDITIEGQEWVGWTRDGKQQRVALQVDGSGTLDVKDEGFASGLGALGLRPDAVKAPKRIDIQEVGGDYAHGIYGLSGDDLVLRLLPGGKQGRPTRFAMTIEDGVLLLYRRIKPADEKE